VGEREWRISLYRGKVAPGRVTFNVRNFGEDGHDLAVRTSSGRVLGAIGELRPGRTATLTVRLRTPGRYRLFCSLEGHEAKGMHAVLRVKRRAQ
jgi:plastocyanin